MQYTPNFNFNLPEGSDLWNYLTQTNPNFAALDTLLKSIQDGTVTTATEVTSGTAHAVTRTLPDANVIRFTATGVWTLGDTMTIDGTPVTVVKPNGTSLQTGDYIIGSEVLGVLRATQFTVYLGAPSSLDAADIDYDNTQSGLAATNVQEAVDEINSNLPLQYVEVTATTNETFTSVLTRLFNQITLSEIKYNSYVVDTAHGEIYILGYKNIDQLNYIFSDVSTQGVSVRRLTVSATSKFYKAIGSTFSDISNDNATGYIFRLYY